MQTKCSVVGWVLVDADQARVLVREEDGQLSSQVATPEMDLGPSAIQTGSFRRGKRIIDPVTQELLGYEMERVPNAIVVAA